MQHYILADWKKTPKAMGDYYSARGPGITGN